LDIGDRSQIILALITVTVGEASDFCESFKGRKVQKELRQVERIALSSQPKGDLHLYNNGECFPVRSVINISPEGISIQLDKYVAVAAEVEFQYKYQDIDIRVNGTVVWNRKTGNPITDKNTDFSYDIGINLISPHILFSLMQSK